MLRRSSGGGIPGNDSAGLLASLFDSLEVVVSSSIGTESAVAEVDEAASIGAAVDASVEAGVSTEAAVVVVVDTAAAGTGVAVACCWALLKINNRIDNVTNWSLIS